MTISLSINRCLHQKKKFEKREQDLLVHKFELWHLLYFSSLEKTKEGSVQRVYQGTFIVNCKSSGSSCTEP